MGREQGMSKDFANWKAPKDDGDEMDAGTKPLNEQDFIPNVSEIRTTPKDVKLRQARLESNLLTEDIKNINLEAIESERRAQIDPAEAKLKLAKMEEKMAGGKDLSDILENDEDQMAA